MFCVTYNSYTLYEVGEEQTNITAVVYMQLHKAKSKNTRRTSKYLLKVRTFCIKSFLGGIRLGCLVSLLFGVVFKSFVLFFSSNFPAKLTE